MIFVQGSKSILARNRDEKTTYKDEDIRPRLSSYHNLFYLLKNARFSFPSLP